MRFIGFSIQTEMFTASAPVSYPSVLHEDIYAQHCEMFEEYFQRVVEEEAGQCPPFVVPPLSKNQARRISAPVHRLSTQHNAEVIESRRQRRSQSLRQPGREHKDKFGNAKDFESFKIPSAPESRNCSCKNKRQRRWKADERTKVQNNEEEPERSHEDPVERKLQLVKLMQGLDCTVVRTFSTSPRGHLINRGESFRRKQSEENNKPPTIQEPAQTQLSPQVETPPPLHPLPPEPQKLTPNGTSRIRKVLVMGYHGVGKTSLLQQFITSEYMGTADPLFDSELEKTVSVQVDDVETTLTFVDLPTEPQKAWMNHTDIEAFVVCYSVTDRNSFNFAVDLLDDLKNNQKHEAAVIVVANKSDLVRARRVSFEEGKSLCQRSSCKFIEVSAAFNHYVDELLVGVVHQIRLNPKRQRAKSVPNTGSNSSTEALLNSKPFSFGCFRGARVFLTEFFFKKTKSKSCDNLWTL